MKIKKIQRELFKAVLDEHHGAKVYEIDKHTSLYTPNGYVGYILRDADCVLDKNKFGKFSEVVKNVDELLNIQGEELTSTKKAILMDKRVLQKFACNKFETYINKQFLKNFDNPTLISKERLGPILVYELNTLVGIVLPVRVTKNDL